MLESKEYKILWSFNIQIDRVEQALRHDLLVINKENIKSQIIDFTVPTDMKWIWKVQRKCRDVAIPVFVDALGAITND